MDNRNLRIFVSILAIFVVSTSLVSAFGISSPYWKNNPLHLSPGESMEVRFNLQNCPSLSNDCTQQDENINVVLEEGNEIATITSGENYDIPFGSHDNYITMIIEIPNDASLGDSYNVKLSPSFAPSSEGGNVQLGLKYNIEFPVVVGEEQGSTITASFESNISGKAILGFIFAGLIVLILAVIIVMYFVVRKR